MFSCEPSLITGISLLSMFSETPLWKDYSDGPAVGSDSADVVGITASVESCRGRRIVKLRGGRSAHLFLQHVMQAAEYLKLHHRKLICLFAEVFALVLGNLLLLHGLSDPIHFCREP